MPTVTVTGLPDWMPVERLLGEGDWQPTEDGVAATLTKEAAADLLARLRGLGFGGRVPIVRVRPSLKRTAIREGRTREARARRDTTPGFQRPGTRLDEVGRFSLTPEALALQIGKSVAGRRVLDLTCGAGGNAIGFARAGCEVIAVERDPHRLELARHNARIYGVQARITFIRGDALRACTEHPCEVCFVDPPWGDWDKAVTSLTDLPLLDALLDELPEQPRLLLKLPPSFDPASLPFPCRVRPWFGRATGDRHRVKFLLATRVSS